MIEQVARFPHVRDRALFVGNPEDVVGASFGPGLPRIRDWTEAHYTFPGYILPFGPADFADRPALRAKLGFREDETVVFAAVGGTGVGHHLLRRIVEWGTPLRRLVPHTPQRRALAPSGRGGLKPPVLFRDGETDGPRRAARMIGNLL